MGHKLKLTAIELILTYVIGTQFILIAGKVTIPFGGLFAAALFWYYITRMLIRWARHWDQFVANLFEVRYYCGSMAEQTHYEHHVAGLLLADIEERQHFLCHGVAGAELLHALKAGIEALARVQQVSVAALQRGQIHHIILPLTPPFPVLRIKLLVDLIKERLYYDLTEANQKLAAIRTFLIDMHQQTILGCDWRFQCKNTALAALRLLGLDAAPILTIAYIDIDAGPEC